VCKPPKARGAFSFATLTPVSLFVYVILSVCFGLSHDTGTNTPPVSLPTTSSSTFSARVDASFGRCRFHVSPLSLPIISNKIFCSSRAFDFSLLTPEYVRPGTGRSRSLDLMRSQSVSSSLPLLLQFGRLYYPDNSFVFVLSSFPSTIGKTFFLGSSAKPSAPALLVYSLSRFIACFA